MNNFESDGLAAEEQSETTDSASHLAPVQRVTPLSKYLALALGIALPFLGGYIGYTYAPEKVVEVEKIVMVEKEVLVDEVDPPTAEQLSGAATGEPRTFIDREVGISFEYPEQWGAVTAEEELGNCPDTYDLDACVQRQYVFSDIAPQAIFLVAESAGHAEYPVGRGAYWGDGARDMTINARADCEAQAGCTVYTNAAGVTFSVYPEDGPQVELGWRPKRYGAYNPYGDFFGVMLSASRLSANPDLQITNEQFEQTVLASFEFIK